MAHDTIAIICKNDQEATFSAAKISRRPGLHRFFVFIDEYPEERNISWMSLDDSCFTLEHAIHWSKDIESIATRAAMLYDNGWNYLFCWADNLPDDQEIYPAIQSLNAKSKFTSDKMWGTTRENIVLNGFESAYRCLDNPENNETFSELEIGLALRGEPVSVFGLMQTMAEVSPLDHVKIIESSLLNEDMDICNQFKKFVSIENEVPTTIIFGSKASNKDIYSVRSIIPKYGAVILITNEKYDRSDLDPYRILKSNQGHIIMFFDSLADYSGSDVPSSIKPFV